MNTFMRWIVVVCAIVLPLPASAHRNEAWPGTNGALTHVAIRHVERTVLGKDIAYYRFDVVAGAGKFDVIRLHRIVRERHPYQPVHTRGGVLMLPGLPNSFEMIFMAPLISKVPAWDHSIAVFLAKNNIDVWGMDYAWALVPANQDSFEFMKNWGLQRDVEHTKIALHLARSIRRLTGQGFGRIHLLGFSYGTFIAYAIANQETQLPRFFRNVKGIIPVDQGVKYPADSILRTNACNGIAKNQALLDAGTYYSASGVALKQIGDLARSAPDDPSPSLGSFTNYQFALFAGASGQRGIGWHFVGGFFDDGGVTTDLRYTDPWLWIDVIRVVPPYAPVRVNLDTGTMICSDVSAPFDDHLAEVSVPILYVGAAGGTGQYGYYTTTLTGSAEVTAFTVQLLTDDQRALDFGHADLFLARDAKTLVWKPILEWIVSHK